MEGMYGELTVPVQRATATMLLRAEVKLITDAQLSEAGLYTSAVLRGPPAPIPRKT